MKEIFTLPFMQNAILTGVISALFLSLFGVFVTLRRLSFFGDGIAHASLTGIAIGVLAGINPLGLGLLTALIFATFIYFLEKKTSLPADAIIGLIFSGGMAMGILLMSFKEGYQPELVSFLFGNILLVSRKDLLFTIFLGFALFLFLILSRRPLALVILDREEAYLSGIRVDILEYLFYLFLSLSVVLGLKLLGVVLVSALLIVPPITAKLIASSFRRLLLYSVILGEISLLSGLFLSFFLDVPPGALIVLVSIAFFSGGMLVSKLLLGRR